jgi:hypothetical protein
MRPSGGLSGGGAFITHTPEVVAVAATTCRWVGGMCSQGVRLLPLTLPPLLLIGGQVAQVCMVKGSGRCGGMDGRVILIFQGA